MKGFPVPGGWLGWYQGDYRLFDTEAEYVAASKEEEQED